MNDYILKAEQLKRLDEYLERKCMNNSEIREKYGLNGKKHGLVLFIQMILVIVGFAITIVNLISGQSDRLICIDLLIIFVVLAGYALIGYKFPITVVQVAVIVIAVTDLIILFTLQGITLLDTVNTIIINCLLIAGAILMSKNHKISQILFGLCFGIDCINFVFKIIHNPGAPMLFFAMSFQFVIMEMTIMLINYSYHQRQQNLQS